MIVNTLKLAKEKSISITGEEKWLEQIYSLYPSPEKVPAPKLKALVRLQPTDYGFINVNANIEYEPFIVCDRCNNQFKWPIKRTLELIFQKPKKLDKKGEIDLQASDLDQYFIDQNGTINLEELINEQIVLAVPSQTRCQKCTSIPKGQLVHSEKSNHNDSPFAALAELKDKLKKH